jgi:hypothetical protein
MDHDAQDGSPKRGGRPRLRIDLLLALGALPALGLAVLVVVVARPDREERGRALWFPCPPRPTAALPFDPADADQLAAHATDVFVGRVVGGAAGPAPASPVPGAPPWLPPMHLLVEVLATEKGGAAGTVVVHQALEFAVEGCHRAVAGDLPVEPGQVLRFVAVRDGPTGTYSLFAGRYSHEHAQVPLGAASPLITPYVTVPSAIPTATAAP